MKTFADYRIDTKGKTSGEVKTQCPECSSSRKKKHIPCLNVNLDKGVWNCWHCGWAGGLGKGVWEPAKIVKTYTRPAYVAQSSGLDDMMGWFKKRGITREVVERNQIGRGSAYFPQYEEERDCIMFPYYRGTEVINIKYRAQGKAFRMAAGAERILYGINDISDTLIWVEGEIDKLSVEVAGFKNCVSVPDGAPAPNTRGYETKFDYLQAPELDRVQMHIVAVDNDEAGTRLKEELCRRLGAERCMIVRWPEGCKDANDVLRLHGADTLSECIETAEPLPIEGAFSAIDFEDDFNRIYLNGTQRGLSTGWYNLDGLYSVRPGELTILTGIPNSGKSEWLDGLMVNLAMANEWGFAVFSAENWPVWEHMKKLAEKYIGKPFDDGLTPRMTEGEKDSALAWLNAYFRFVVPETPTLPVILETFGKLVLRHGVKGIVIDPWNEVDHQRPATLSETEYISQSLSEIRRFARSHGVHAWVVAHPTKLQKDVTGNYPVPSPYDIAGSANWRNKADNCISVWRDLNPEIKSKEVEIHIQKVRNKIIGQLGMGKLEYDRVTGRYSNASNY